MLTLKILDLYFDLELFFFTLIQEFTFVYLYLQLKSTMYAKANIKRIKQLTVFNKKNIKACLMIKS